MIGTEIASAARLSLRASRAYYKRAREGRSVWRESREMERETLLRVCAGVSVAKNQSTVSSGCVFVLRGEVFLVILVPVESLAL